MNARVVYSLVSGVAIASACAFACSGNDAVTNPATDKDAGEDAHPSGIDSATNEQDSGSSGDDALLPGGWETTPPSDFPAHFAGISPPTALDDLTGLCAIDTGSATSAPSFSICETPTSTPVVVTTSPNLVVVDGVNALVLWADTLDIKDDVKVTGTRALALFETHTLTIDGTIDVSAIGPQAGPGAVTSGNGAPGNSSANDFPGGGGGGFGTNGGLGGDTSDAGTGSIAYGADAAAFTGGSSGGYATQTTCAAGGGGGGAIQISVAGSLLVMQKGAVLANGGGGQGACATSLGAGAGGGSGGTIFLESLALFSIEGKILANGGGGGGSSPAASTKGESGDDANLLNTPAGGGSGSASGASGGNGGIGTSSAEDGALFFANPQTLGGGGGGAIGRIWIRTKSAPTGIGATFGPPPVGLTF